MEKEELTKKGSELFWDIHFKIFSSTLEHYKAENSPDVRLSTKIEKNYNGTKRGFSLDLWFHGTKGPNYGAHFHVSGDGKEVVIPHSRNEPELTNGLTRIYGGALEDIIDNLQKQGYEKKSSTALNTTYIRS